MSLDPGQPRERQRLLLRQAVSLQGIQGTPRGIALAVEAVFGLRAEVQETGAVSWSMDADAALPGEPLQAFVVQVFATEGQPVDEQRLDLVVSVAQARTCGAPGRGGAELTSQAVQVGVDVAECSAVETRRQASG